MNALDFLEQTLDVPKIKVVGQCRVCHHEWAISVPRWQWDEVEPEKSSAWVICQACKARESAPC